MICRGLSGRPLHPFGCILLREVFFRRNEYFTFHLQPTFIRRGAEGFQGAIGKPLGIITNDKKQETAQALIPLRENCYACSRGLCGRPLHPFAASLRMKRL